MAVVTALDSGEELTDALLVVAIDLDPLIVVDFEVAPAVELTTSVGLALSVGLPLASELSVEVTLAMPCQTYPPSTSVVVVPPDAITIPLPLAAKLNVSPSTVIA